MKTSKAAKMQAALAQQQIAEQQAALAAAEKDRALSNAKAQELANQQLEFNRQQQAFAEEQARKNEEIAARPAPPPPPPAAIQVTGGSVADSSDASDEVALRKKGRAALRIDMGSPQTAGATGLNIARG